MDGPDPCPNLNAFDHSLTDQLVEGYSSYYKRFHCHWPITHTTHNARSRLVHYVQRSDVICRVGHGLGPSMGWVGLGWVRVLLIFGGLGWVGWRLDCVIF